MKGSFKFPKKEKLKRTKEIEKLFTEGSSFHVYPVRIVFSCRNTVSKPELKVAFSVSKKKFKSAVARNRIKRLMRESFRLGVPDLRIKLKEIDCDLHAMFIFTGVEMPDLKTVLKSFHKILNRLMKELEAMKV